MSVHTEHLRQLRDQLIGEIKPASIQAVFTPIKGIFSFSFDEDLININPIAGVKLPRDKRPIEERKWKPFEPAEVMTWKREVHSEHDTTLIETFGYEREEDRLLEGLADDLPPETSLSLM